MFGEFGIKLFLNKKLDCTFIMSVMSEKLIASVFLKEPIILPIHLLTVNYEIVQYYVYNIVCLVFYVILPIQLIIA